MNFHRLKEFGERLSDLITRVGGYIREEPAQVLIEFMLVWLVVYAVFRFLRGTRGAWAIKGVTVILIAGTVMIRVLGFERLSYLYANFLQLAAIILIVVFQPELRRALVRIGETPWFGRQTGLKRARVIEELVASSEYLAKRKIGALIAIEREVGLRGIIEQGTVLNAELSQELIDTIFWPNSKLHDLGVVIRADQIAAAGVQFPLAEAGSTAAELGSRHRAAVGLSIETDALVLVVSEETGKIRLAERGKLSDPLNIDALRTSLTQGLADVTLTRNADLPDDAAVPTQSSGSETTTTDKNEPPSSPSAPPSAA